MFGGDEEDRTLGLTDANRTLSQLSYVPTLLSLLFKYTTIAIKIQEKKRNTYCLRRKESNTKTGWPLLPMNWTLVVWNRHCENERLI